MGYLIVTYSLYDAIKLLQIHCNLAFTNKIQSPLNLTTNVTIIWRRYCLLVNLSFHICFNAQSTTTNQSYDIKNKIFRQFIYKFHLFITNQSAYRFESLSNKRKIEMHFPIENKIVMWVVPTIDCEKLKLIQIFPNNK